MHFVDGSGNPYPLTVSGTLRFENVEILGAFEVTATGNLSLHHTRLRAAVAHTPPALVDVVDGTLLVDGGNIEYSTTGVATIRSTGGNVTIRDSHIVRRGNGYAVLSERTTLALEGNCRAINTATGQCEPPTLFGVLSPDQPGIFADNATAVRAVGGNSLIHTNMFVNLADPSRDSHSTLEFERSQVVLANNWIGGWRAEVTVHLSDSDGYSQNNLIAAAPNPRDAPYDVVRAVFVEGGIWVFDHDSIGVGYASNNQDIAETRAVDCEGHCSFRGGIYGGAVEPDAALSRLGSVRPIGRPIPGLSHRRRLCTL